MFAVFLYGTVPHEYLHDVFAHHHDTTEGRYKKGEFHLSKAHVHCAFLGITFGSFLFSEYIFYKPAILFHISKWVMPGYHFHSLSSYYSYSLRGPPSFIS
ncbi:MAG: hypothetical protein P4L41_07190 [Flavipsychrobacter sp.]|nr:hypothetical protein [Flavipsychrobacter sp.]